MNYYNDHDPFCCAWLKELIADGLIPEGEVDGRPIEEVEPGDLRGFIQCHFFCGVAGWSLALGLAGWPADRPVWTGSCPCQPLSCAGKGKGHEDKRHLWPEFYRLIRECRPPVVFGEQVASKAGRGWLDGISLDMEDLEFAVGAADLCAAGIGAPHIRQRLFWVAKSEGVRRHERKYARDMVCAPRTEYRDEQEFIPNGSFGLCPPGGLADASDGDGWSGERREETGIRQDSERRRGSSGGGFWSPSLLIPCADGKLRRVPGEWVDNSAGPRCDGAGEGTEEKARDEAWMCGSEQGCRNGFTDKGPETQPGLQLVLPDGFSSGLVHLRPSRELFPLSEGCKNRVGILRGAGNSIVPSLAAEFVKAFMEVGA